MHLMSSWQLRTADDAGRARRSMVLPGGPQDLQPIAGFPRCPVPRAARRDRSRRDPGARSPEHRSCCGHAARTGYQPAKRGALATPQDPRGPIIFWGCRGDGTPGDVPSHIGSVVARSRADIAEPSRQPCITDPREGRGATGFWRISAPERAFTSPPTRCGA